MRPRIRYIAPLAAMWALAGAGSTLAAPPAPAEGHAEHAAHSAHAHGAQAAHEAHAVMMGDMARMMEVMTAAPMTGNADIDFAAMMIPHHQGAIDMARYQLAHGTDPAMRRLAQEIIVTQQAEIEVMQRRLEMLRAAEPAH